MEEKQARVERKILQERLSAEKSPKQQKTSGVFHSIETDQTLFDAV